MTTGEVIALIKAFGGGSGGGGTGGGVLVVHDVSGTLDKTWKEIADAASAGIMPVLFVDCNGEHGDAGVLLSYYVQDGAYIVELGTWPYAADSASGYPTSST